MIEWRNYINYKRKFKNTQRIQKDLFQFSLEYQIPELGRYTETKFEVAVVVLQVVRLHLLEVVWQSGVVECVVHTVVKNVEGK